MLQEPEPRFRVRWFPGEERFPVVTRVLLLARPNRENGGSTMAGFEDCVKNV